MLGNEKKFQRIERLERKKMNVTIAYREKIEGIRAIDFLKFCFSIAD